ncbi:MAG: hypothetical protein K2Y13_16530 [Burkholderiaceae bacterium]|nr:hypothetical protein [Burkholderiaceae bacterium]
MLFLIASIIPLVLYIVIPVKKKYRYFGAFFVTIFYCLLLFPSLRQTHLLSKYGVHQTGILISKNCSVKSKPQIQYRFMVGEKQVTGSGRPGEGNPSCQNFQIGDQVFITYLPSDETINVAERGVEDHTLAAIVSFIALYFFLLWVGNEQEKFRKNKLSKIAN